MKKPRTSPRSAFTLIELLVVMGIIVLMGALVVPAVSGTLKGTALNQAAQTIQAQFNAAQQLALAKGQPIDMRIIMCGDPDSPTADSDDVKTFYLRGIQLFSVAPGNDPTDTTAKLRYTPLTKLEYFPNTVIIDSGPVLSSICIDKLLVQSSASEDYQHPKLPRIGLNYKYYHIQFRADGTTNLDTNLSWFLTLHDQNRGDRMPSPPSNFFTIAVDPVQGSNRTFRPM